MEEECLKSHIDPQFKRKMVSRAALFSIAAMSLLILSALFIPLNKMEILGLPIFLLALAGLYYGTLPYRRLLKEELISKELLFYKDRLVYRRDGRNLFSIPLTTIESLDFYHGKTMYGARIFLNVPFSEKLLISSPELSLDSFYRKSKRGYKCDLFIPFIQRPACNISCMRTIPTTFSSSKTGRA